MIIPVGFAQINWHFIVADGTRDAQCTIAVDHSGGSGTPDDLAAIAQDAMASAVMPDVSDTWQLDKTHVKFGPNATGLEADNFDTATGGASAASVPSNTAVLVRKVTAEGGRRQRGRLYMVGLPETARLGSDRILDANVTTLQGDWNDLKTAFDDADLPLVLLHGHPDDTPTVISHMTVENVLATQRRRMRK